jgi:hypothetical protein
MSSYFVFYYLNRIRALDGLSAGLLLGAVIDFGQATAQQSGWKTLTTRYTEFNIVLKKGFHLQI